MSLSDAFTGDPAKEAAAQTRAFLTNTQNAGNATIQGGLTNATNAVNAGAAGSLNSLGQGYNTATGAVNSGATDASAALQGGYDAAAQQYDAARAAYNPLKKLGAKYGTATTLALNSLGANGQAGQDAARDAFKTGPGYNFNLDQGLNAIDRARNARGMGNSGNTDRDAQNYGAGLASNEYDKWMSNLLGFTNPELSATSGAASGIAGVDTTQAGAANQLGQNQAAVAGTRGAMLADLASRYGTSQAGIQTGQGNTLAGLQTGAAGQTVGLSKDLALPYTNTYGQEAAAQQQGSANLVNLGLNAAKLAVGGAGGLGGGNSATGTFGATSGNWAAPAYQAAYGTPSQLFPGTG